MPTSNPLSSNASDGWPMDRPVGRLTFKHALVVIDEDVLRSKHPLDTTLLARAKMLAQRVGCRLELFHVCYDDSLDQGLFKKDQGVSKEQLEAIDRDATRLGEIALELHRDSGIEVDHETRWDRPLADAIIRRAFEMEADLVMKTAGQSNYLIGLMTNTDWELIRQSPAHLWFVNEETTHLEHMITAVGSFTEEVFDRHDYDVGELSMLLSEKLQLDNSVVHTYLAPTNLASYSGYAPELSALTAAAEPPISRRDDLARSHGKAIRAWADYFHLEPERFRVVQGRPADVLPEMTEAINANLLVMGARNLNRLERLVKPVTAEPVLARACCDVVFLREDVSASDIPEPSRPPVYGIPRVDIDQAVVDPERTFQTPEKLVEQKDLSIAMRLRILRLWEHDVRRLMDEEDEGGPTGTSKAGLLSAIHSARQALDAERHSSPAPQPEFN